MLIGIYRTLITNVTKDQKNDDKKNETVQTDDFTRIRIGIGRPSAGKQVSTLLKGSAVADTITAEEEVSTTQGVQIFPSHK